MSCGVSIGLDIPCKATGGVKNLYVGEHANLSGITKDADDKITDVDAVTVYRAKLKNGTAEYGGTDAGNPENNAAAINQELSFPVFLLAAATRKELNSWRKNPALFVIIEDMNGSFLLLGEVNGLECTVEDKAGKVAGDMNGYMVVFSGEEPNMASHIDDPSTIANITITEPA